MTLNSRPGFRKAKLTKNKLKCMVKLEDSETVLGRQQKTLKNEKTNLHIRML